MSGTVDLNTLTREQLVYLVQVRGQALEFNSNADRTFIEKLTGPDFTQADMNQYMEAKNAIALDFMAAEEQIIGGAGRTAN